MDWAKDYRGEIVQAQRGAYLCFGMICPTCGEPVYLRQGQKRRPHFAHYSNRAKPDCEYYHPPQDALQRSVSRSVLNNSTLYPKRDSLRCGLFLAYRPEITSFELFLRIPSVASVGQLSGSLEIQHGKGVKEFTATQLTKAYTVSISPTVPLLECEGDGDLLAVSNHLMGQTGSFALGMNLFAATESRGRFLFTREPLEWGGRYWVVTDTPITPPDQVTAVIEWSRCGSLAQWHVYEVELPSKLIASHWNTTKEILPEFFGRSIRPHQPRAYIVHPSPHHLAADGAHVYPQSPEILYVRRTTNHKVSVGGPPDLLTDIQIAALDGEWVRIKGIQPSTQDVAILIDGIEQAVLRIETCDLIQPVGLRAYTWEVTWDLLVDTPLRPDELFAQEIRVECGSDRLAEYIAKINEARIIDGSAVMLLENTDKTLNAGGFGEIRPECSNLEERQDTDQETASWCQNRQLPEVIWIDSLICTRHGPKTAALIRDFIANPSQGNLNKLGLILTSPLMAYIRAATELQRQQLSNN